MVIELLGELRGTGGKRGAEAADVDSIIGKRSGDGAEVSAVAGEDRDLIASFCAMLGERCAEVRGGAEVGEVELVDEGEAH